jgi:hypothetical protein
LAVAGALAIENNSVRKCANMLVLSSLRDSCGGSIRRDIFGAKCRLVGRTYRFCRSWNRDLRRVGIRDDRATAR